MFDISKLLYVATLDYRLLLTNKNEAHLTKGQNTSAFKVSI